jgi:hypothetical protein
MGANIEHQVNLESTVKQNWQKCDNESTIKLTMHIIIIIKVVKPAVFFC